MRRLCALVMLKAPWSRQPSTMPLQPFCSGGLASGDHPPLLGHQLPFYSRGVAMQPSRRCCHRGNKQVRQSNYVKAGPAPPLLFASALLDFRKPVARLLVTPAVAALRFQQQLTEQQQQHHTESKICPHKSPPPFTNVS